MQNPRKFKTDFRLKAVCVSVLMAIAAQPAMANPLNPQVMSGQASFASAGNVMTVTNTPGAIINWSSFSIGKSETTRFVQQSAASSVLNRVTGVDPSSILGSLQSNGRVFLINPNGIVFGAGSTVDVAGMVASTLNLSNADFLAGRNHFTAIPNAGNISNAGNITTANAGHVYLIAPNVENTGVITSPNGEILLAAGSNVDLVNSASPNLRVNITAGAGNATNVGQLVATSGRLGLFGALVKNSGTVNADGVVVQGGEVIFKASSRAEVSGTVSANGTAGGAIQALGNEVGIMAGATITANGTQGGGTILVGGDTKGLNPAVQNAQVSYVDPTAAISADATQNGNGGKVIVWADNTTRMYGKISARGGALSGNGGFVETSGKKVLDVTSAPDVFAPNGTSGVWLLDPETINITATANANITGASPFTPAAAGTSTLNNATVVAALNAGGTVTIDTTGGGAGVGDINVNATIVPTTALASTLNLNAHGNINVNTGIGSVNGVLNMNFTPGQAGGAGTTNVIANISPNGGTATFNKASTFSGSTLGGNVAASTFVNPAGATMTFKSETLSNITLNNSGTINQTANAALTSANVLLTGGTIFNNLAGATLNLNSAIAGSVMYTNNSATINNSGTINQVSAAYTVIQSGAYNAAVLTGAMTFNEAATGVINGVGAPVYLQTSTTTLTGNLTLQGSGLWMQAINRAPASTWTTLAPTTVTGPLTLWSDGAVLNLNASAGALTNQGTITLSSGNINQTGVLNNQGTLTFGTTPWSYTLGDLNNTGTLTSTGTSALNLTGSYTQSGAGTITAAAAGFTMNAGTDITLNNALTKPAGSGLWSLNAKRSVALNSSITTNNTAFNAVANSAGTNNNGTATPATMTLGAGATINAGTGTVNLAVTGGNFFNNSGSTTPITAGNTRIYSTDPRLNDVGGMAAQSRLYSCTYALGCGVGVTIPATNTVYLYSIANPNLALTVAANPLSKVYGNADPALTYAVTGLVGGDTAASVLTGNVARVSGENVGAYAINQGTLATNAYILSYTANNLSITPAPLTVNGTVVANKVYNGTTTASLTGGTLVGTVLGDVLTLTQAGTFASKNVGTGIAVTAADVLGGAAAGNYTLTQPTPLAANITAAPLTVNGTVVANKVYDGTTTASLTGGTLVGTVLGDVLTLTQAGTFASKNVGTGIAVTAADVLGGAAAGNYTLTQPTPLAANITAAPLTVNGTVVANKVYDGTTTASLTGGTLVGTVLGDVLTLTQAGTFASKNVGTGIAVTAADVLGGAAAGNYTLTQPTPLTANITGKALTVGGITASNKVYDGTTAATVNVAGATYTGLVAGDVLAVNATGTFADKNAAVGKTVTLTSGYTGADVANYTITNQGTTTADITAKALTVAATGINKVYDATTAATVTLADNRIAGDVLTTGYTSAAFLDKNVALGKAVNVAGITLAGADATNYSFNTTAATTADITAKALTVGGITAANKVYDGTTAATVNVAGATYTGLVAGDVLAVNATGTFADKNAAVGKTVTLTSGYTGADVGNYLIAGQSTTTANITAKALTVAATGINKVYDATTAATVTLADNRIAGDVLTTGYTSAAFLDKNVALGKTVNVAGITLAGVDATNYSFNSTAATTADITAKALTVGGITAANKVYDGTTAATVNVAGATYTGLVAGDIVTANAAGATGSFVDKNVGINKGVNIAGITLAGADALNYTFNNTAATTANITAKALTVGGITASNKVYDGTTAATVNVAGATYTGLVAGDVLAVNATGTFADKNAAVGKTVTLTSGYTGADVGNYLIAGQSTTTANITAKALTVAATGINKVYDATTAATVTLADNRIAGDVLTTGYTSAAFLDKNVALGKTLNVAGITLAGADATNYSFNTTAATTADITAKALTVAATGINKVYDATTAATVTLADNRIAGDVLTTGYTSAAFLDKNVALGKAVNVAGITLAGADATNYSFNTTAATTADITAKALTVGGITAANKVYDGTTAATVNVAGATYTGLVAGDVLAVNATGTFADKNAAVGKTVTLTSGYTGADVANYTITNQGTTTADITAKALTVAATGINKVYDATTAATVTLADNRIAGDVLTTGYTSAAFLDKNVALGKAVNVAGITLAGADATNYSFNTTAATTADITAKALTVGGITAANKVYDGTTAATVNVAGATYTGLVAGDVLAVNATGTFADKNAAVGKTVTLVSGYTGADVANYTITNQGTTTADITAKALTVAATGINKVYDATTAATVTLADNRVAGDVLTTGYTSAAFLDKNVALGKAVNVAGITLAGADATNYSFNTTAATTADITAKALTVAATGINKVYDATTAATVTLADNRIAGDVLTTGYTSAAFLDKNVALGKTVNVAGITLAGVDATNYSFNTTAATTADITAKALTVGGITAANKVYDGTTAATVNVAGATYTGLVAGDVLAVNATGTFADKNTAVGKTVTLVSGYTGADVANYTITNQGTTTADITPAILAVAANAAGKVYGSVDPAFSYTAIGLVAGDSVATVLTGVQARVAGENVGAYAINQGTLASSANYTLAYTVNNLTITPASLSVIANAQTKASGAVDPALTYVTTGFKFADTVATALTGGLSRIAGEAAGAYAINQGLLASSANYTIAYTGNNLTINAAPVGAAVVPVDIVNTILIPGNTAPGTAHSTIQTANTLNNQSASTDTVVQMDNVNNTASSVALVCREGGVSGGGVLAAINSMPPTAAGGSGYSYQGLQAVPLCVMSVR